MLHYLKSYGQVRIILFLVPKLILLLAAVLALAICSSLLKFGGWFAS